MEQLFQNKKEENVGTARIHMKCRSFSEKNLISSGQNWLKIYKFLQMNLPFILFTLKIAEKRSERQRRKGKIYPSECRAPENSKERQERLFK